MSRQASLIAADELMYSINGKMTAVGIYATDITIPTDPTYGNQLIFLFIIETSPDDVFKELKVRVDLPGGDMREREIDVETLVPGQADSIRWRVMFPLLFQNPILKPGPIVASVIHDEGTLSPAAPFLVLRPTAPAADSQSVESPKH